MRQRSGPWVATLLALAVLVVALPAPGAAPPMRFGMDPDSVAFLAAHGAKPDYAAYWAGTWNERAGWSYLGTIADQLADQGVVPLVHWYYWGGDISPRCIDHGCWGGGVWKSQAKWNEGAVQLAKALHQGLRGRPGVVVLETEFNKNGVGAHEPFDGYLAKHTRIFRQHAPEVQLVLGFGNWKPEQWGTFDKAAAAVDMVGFQTMRGSTRDSLGSYLGAVDAIKAATVRLEAEFGKPVLLHDLALSSHWMPQWGREQEREVRELFHRLGELRAAGLAGIVYRGLDDDPGFTTKEYYGVAERHFGLRDAKGAWKPALDDWIGGVKAVRGSWRGPAPDPGPRGDSSGDAPGPEGAAASFGPRAVGNPWWVEVRVEDYAAHRVEARVGSGAWRELGATPWGSWAASFPVPPGAAVQFRAHGPDGPALSQPVAWAAGAAVPAPAPMAAPPGASFMPKAVGNDWWVEVRVDPAGRGSVAKVEARLDDGPWVALPRLPWGAHGKSIHAPDGTAVQFRAALPEGVASSPTYRW
jgi:hypothetical protein